jgi:hypothetical protein
MPHVRRTHFSQRQFFAWLTNAEVSALWLKRLPHAARDEEAASNVVCNMKADGWSVELISVGTVVRCVVEKYGLRFESAEHSIRAAAITDVAARAAHRWFRDAADRARDES